MDFYPFSSPSAQSPCRKVKYDRLIPGGGIGLQTPERVPGPAVRARCRNQMQSERGEDVFDHWWGSEPASTDYDREVSRPDRAVAAAGILHSLSPGAGSHAHCVISARTAFSIILRISFLEKHWRGLDASLNRSGTTGSQARWAGSGGIVLLAAPEERPGPSAVDHQAGTPPGHYDLDRTDLPPPATAQTAGNRIWNNQPDRAHRGLRPRVNKSRGSPERPVHSQGYPVTYRR
jgi:hypothetical protein